MVRTASSPDNKRRNAAMKTSDLIKRLLDGEKLSEAERSALAGFREPDSQTHVPRSRLDQETALRQELEARIGELENRGLSEDEKNRRQVESLSRQLETLSAERDSLARAREELEFKTKVNAVAGKFDFDNHEYLAFLMRGAEVSPDDESATNAFIEKLRDSSPAHFKVKVNPGGAGSGSQSPIPAYAEARSKGDIESMIASAPAAI